MQEKCFSVERPSSSLGLVDVGLRSIFFFGFLVWTRVVSLCSGKLVKMVSGPFQPCQQLPGQEGDTPGCPSACSRGPQCSSHFQGSIPRPREELWALF